MISASLTNGSLSHMAEYYDATVQMKSIVVTGAGGTATFTYDANGNRKTGDGKALTYTAFTKPATITAGRHHGEFAGRTISPQSHSVNDGPSVLWAGSPSSSVWIGASHGRFRGNADSRRRPASLA